MTTVFSFGGELTVEVFTGTFAELRTLAGDGWQTWIVGNQPMACRAWLGAWQERPNVEMPEPVVSPLHAETGNGATERTLHV